MFSLGVGGWGRSLAKIKDAGSKCDSQCIAGDETSGKLERFQVKIVDESAI